MFPLFLTISPMAAFETLMGLQKAGKIRHIGVSNFGSARLDEALATGAEIVINELPYSLLTRAIELALAGIVELFEREVYGRVPPNAPKVSWRVAESDTGTIAGRRVIEQVGQLAGRGGGRSPGSSSSTCTRITPSPA